MRFTLELIYPSGTVIKRKKTFKTKDGRTGWALAKRWHNKIVNDHYNKTNEFYDESVLENLDHKK